MVEGVNLPRDKAALGINIIKWEMSDTLFKLECPSHYSLLLLKRSHMPLKPQEVRDRTVSSNHYESFSQNINGPCLCFVTLKQQFHCYMQIIPTTLLPLSPSIVTEIFVNDQLALCVHSEQSQEQITLFRNFPTAVSILFTQCASFNHFRRTLDLFSHHSLP